MKYWRQPLDKHRIPVPRGVIHFIAERCKGCGFCVEFCPQNVLFMSKKSNTKGYRLPEITVDSHCLNCGICMLLCPDFAIYVEDSGVQPPTAVEATSNIEVKK